MKKTGFRDLKGKKLADVQSNTGNRFLEKFYIEYLCFFHHSKTPISHIAKKRHKAENQECKREKIFGT